MQFLRLIYDQEKRWTALSAEEQNSETLGFVGFGKDFARAVQGGNALPADIHSEDRAGAGWKTHGDGRAIYRDKGATGRVLPGRGKGYRRSGRRCREHSVGADRIDRSATDHVFS